MTKQAKKAKGLTLRVAATVARASGAGEQVVKPGELVTAEMPQGASLSAAARKVMVLLLQAAGPGMAEDREHCLPLAALRGSHAGNERVRQVLDELQRTLLRVRYKAPDGRDAVLVEAIMTRRVEHADDDARAMVWWKFSEAMRLVMEASDHFAILHRQTVLALESRYAVTLYELGALLHARYDPVWRGTLPQVRELLGVPAGKLKRWVDLKRFVLDPAVGEVNHLATFGAAWMPFSHAGTVIGVELRFWRKAEEERSAALREIDGSRVGRKARRGDQVEKVVNPALAAALDALKAGAPPPGAGKPVAGEVILPPPKPESPRQKARKAAEARLVQARLFEG